MFKILDVDKDSFTQLVSGHANGVDKIGEKWARLNGIDVISFPANWYTLGRSAGVKRNIEMGNYADSLIAIWDGKSRGTNHMIDYMTKLGKPVRVVQV